MKKHREAIQTTYTSVFDDIRETICFYKWS